VPGKRTLTQGLLQRKSRAAPPAPEEADPLAAATAGVAGAGESLPHLDPIQRSFGAHDVTHVHAHVGGAAATASAALGAEAYATGDQVAFAAPPSLHTAAHEAAHVVQQRAGVSLKGGLGEAGDVHEQHADAVADAVVRGESAEALLGAYSGGGESGTPGGSLVQRQTWPHEIVNAGITEHGEPSQARTERDYDQAAAVSIGDDRYRLWGFRVNSAAPRTEFAEVLGQIASQLVKDADARVRLTGHTSRSGGEAKNFNLSVERAGSVLQQLAARGVQIERIMSLGAGESTPIADESEGASAMARNRRVEVSVLPGQGNARNTKDESEDADGSDGPEPGASPPITGYRISCGEADFHARLVNAQVIAWTMVASGSRNPVTQQPRMTWETYMQPSAAEWEAACRSERISKKWCDYIYPNLTIPVNSDLNEKIRVLKEERDMYRALATGAGGCGGEPSLPRAWTPPKDPGSGAPASDAPATPQDGNRVGDEYKPRVMDRDDIDRMPGDVDPKGRYY
jgi:outer membrane protein OmpA-like peptidoglycan-associated protein